MAVNFITVLNGVITGRHHGDLDCNFYGTEYYGHEKMEVPSNTEVRVFDRLEFYSEDWQRKSDIQLIDAGLIPMPQGYVREGDTLRLMSKEERVIAGLDEPQAGTRVEGGKIVPLTFQEQYEAGLITEAAYRQRLTAANTQELNNRITALQTPEVLAQAELDEAFAAGRKAKLAAMLAVKQQPLWPLEVQWPED